jgi:energy-coupling factor transport system ATP-binding protein
VKSEVVLDNLSFTIQDGTMTAIIGHNGSGKSTIAKLIMGLLEPISGEIYINDELLTLDNLDRLRSKMGIIFQNPDNQFVGATVKDDMAFGLENHLIERSEMLRRIEKYSKLIIAEYVKY